MQTATEAKRLASDSFCVLWLIALFAYRLQCVGGLWAKARGSKVTVTV